jgi:hypothetical protein
LFFEYAKTIRKELSSARNRQKPLGSIFFLLLYIYDDCLAQDKFRELKPVSLKLPENDNSLYVLEFF